MLVAYIGLYHHRRRHWRLACGSFESDGNKSGLFYLLSYALGNSCFVRACEGIYHD